MSQQEYSGSCYCENIKFTVKSPVLGAQICHCSICRRLQGSSMGLIAAFFSKDNFKITQGQDQIKEYLSPKSCSRMFCKNCGTRVYLGFEKFEQPIPMVVIYPTLLTDITQIPQELAPQRHIYYTDRLYDINDNKPKFADMPTEFGGTGRLLNSDGSRIGK